jgi:hypothetical protein
MRSHDPARPEHVLDEPSSHVWPMSLATFVDTKPEPASTPVWARTLASLPALS